MATTRRLTAAIIGLLITLLLAGCAANTATPSPGPKPPQPTTKPSGGTNPVARLGLGTATSIEVLAFVTQGPGGQPGYVPRRVISDTAAVAQVLGSLNAELKKLPKALCVPEYELRFRLPGGAVKKVMYSCEGASFLRSDDPSWGDSDLQPPAAFDKLMSDLLSSSAPMPPAVAETGSRTGRVRA